MIEQCSIETSQPAFDLQLCKKTEGHRLGNSHCEHKKTYNSPCTSVSWVKADSSVWYMGMHITELLQTRPCNMYCCHTQ